MAGFQLICCVVNMGDASKALKIAKKHGVKGGTITIGRGTIQSRLLDFLGINEMRKEIITMIVEDELADEALKGLCEGMQFEKPHHGIAYSHPVSQFIGSINRVSATPSNIEVKNSVYKIIHVIVDKGRGEDVVDAANKAGARGGTIVNARGAGIHEVQKLFSIEIEPGKQEVFIITKADVKDEIVKSIRENLHIDEPGKGILYVLDINEVYGLHKDSKDS